MADGYAARFDQTPYTAVAERLLDGVLAMPGDDAFRIRAGIRPGPGLGISIGSSPESATLAGGGGVISDVAGGGSYRFVIPAAVTKQLAVRPGPGNARIDVLTIAIHNVDHRPADGTREVYVNLLTGQAGSAPSVPTIPDGQLAVWRLDVPASGAIAVTSLAPRTAALGGTVPVANQGERDAIASPWQGLTVLREDLGVKEVYARGAWQRMALTYTYQDSDAFTAAAGLTRIYARVQYRPGETVTAHLRLTAAAAIPAGTSGLVLGTFNTLFKPLNQPGIMVGYPGGLTASIATGTPAMTLRSAAVAVSAGTDVILTGTWPATDLA